MHRSLNSVPFITSLKVILTELAFCVEKLTVWVIIAGFSEICSVLPLLNDKVADLARLAYMFALKEKAFPLLTRTLEMAWLPANRTSIHSPTPSPSVLPSHHIESSRPSSTFFGS